VGKVKEGNLLDKNSLVYWYTKTQYLDIPQPKTIIIGTGHSVLSSILATYSIPDKQIFVAPDVLSTNWSNIVRTGRIPKETLFEV
jgi:hypothetical protein